MSEDTINQEINQEQSLPTTHEEWYNQIKLLVESMQSDVLKSQRNNKAAGVRLRKSLRFLKEETGAFVKFTLGKS
tara:strand:+ start:227 stop:451 length:225 start_codon:yes stop_codon:yes gene_type:complete